MRTLITPMKAVALIRKTAKYHCTTYAHMYECTIVGLVLLDGSKLYRFLEQGTVQWVHITRS